MPKAARKDALARQVVDLAKAAVLAENYFLGGAVGRLNVTRAELETPFATDGYFLAYDPDQVLASFTLASLPPSHDLLHSVVHCLFLHPYVGASIDKNAWDLACDLVCERAVSELLGPRPGSRGASIASVMSAIQRELGGRASAERIYRNLKSGMWANAADSWAALVHSDDHGLWYKPTQDGNGQSGAGSSTDGSDQGGVGRTSGESDNVDVAQGGSQEQPGGPEQRQQADNSTLRNAGIKDGPGETREPDTTSMPPLPEGNTLPGRNPADTEARDSVQRFTPNQGGADITGVEHTPVREQEKEQWRALAASLSVNLETLLSRLGGRLPGFREDLQSVSASQADYAAFLRRFATHGEVLHTSDADFDYVFYTYGLARYGNMPLIEPLEYREEKRIREFVIVLDTSGSVQGNALRSFVQATFDIMRASETFFSHIHVRIIQCDTEVRSDSMITSSSDLERYCDQLVVRGGGGTDFRPAFAYIDQLVADGAFWDLGGVVYFTDGWGTYPEWTPRYPCAFVFYDEDHRPETVPPWAVQLVMGDEALARALQQA
ncbi:MAG: hypothetical protein IJ131_00020 [Eggerthellaceae bacterium]|nr:hypothetical protein [Eggerthellaceae bacterium]